MERGRMADDGVEVNFSVASAFGADTKRGYVRIECQGIKLTLNPAEARMIGMQIVGAAEIAENDEAYATLMLESGVDTGTVRELMLATCSRKSLIETRNHQLMKGGELDER